MTTNEEQQVEVAGVRRIGIGERMAAVEAQQELLIDVVRENGRRSEESYKALNAKIDRLTYLTIGVGGAVTVGIVIQLVS